MRLFRRPGKGLLEVILALVLVIESCLGWAQDISFGSSGFRQGELGLIGLSCVSGRSFLVSGLEADDSLADGILRRDLELYFTALAVPQDNWWVNLAEGLGPREILGKGLEYTELGKILLEADLKLKDFARRKLLNLFKWQDISWQGKVRLRFWIVPEKSVVFVDRERSTCWVGDIRLKVRVECFGQNKDFCQVVKRRVVPQLRRLVNHDASFRDLRRASQLMALACYSKRLGIYPKDEVDSYKTLGLFSKEYWTTTDMWFRYHSLQQENDEFGNQLRLYGGFDATGMSPVVKEATRLSIKTGRIELRPISKGGRQEGKRGKSREKGFFDYDVVIALYTFTFFSSITSLFLIPFSWPYSVVTFLISGIMAIFSFINVIVLRLIIRYRRRRWNLASQEMVKKFQQYVTKRLIVAYVLLTVPFCLESWGIWLANWPGRLVYFYFLYVGVGAFIGLRFFKDRVEAEKMFILLGFLRRWDEFADIDVGDVETYSKGLFVTNERDILRVIALNGIFGGKRVEESLRILWQLCYADLYYVKGKSSLDKYKNAIYWLEARLKSGTYELKDLLKDIPSLRVEMDRLGLGVPKVFLDMMRKLNYGAGLSGIWAPEEMRLDAVLRSVDEKGIGVAPDGQDYKGLFEKLGEVKEEMRQKYGDDAVMEYRVIWNTAILYMAYKEGIVQWLKRNVERKKQIKLGSFVIEFLFLLMKWANNSDEGKLKQLIEMFKRLDRKIEEYRKESGLDDDNSDGEYDYYSWSKQFYTSDEYKDKEGGIDLKDWQIEYQVVK